MSETRLVIVDAEANYEGTIHASMIDACIAALSAEPETFAELQAVEGLQPSPNVRTEPWDAGIVIIDLAAHVLAWESTYSHPQSEGSVDYHDGRPPPTFRFAIGFLIRGSLLNRPTCTLLVLLQVVRVERRVRRWMLGRYCMDDRYWNSLLRRWGRSLLCIRIITRSCRN